MYCAFVVDLSLISLFESTPSVSERRRASEQLNYTASIEIPMFPIQFTESLRLTTEGQPRRLKPLNLHDLEEVL